MTICVLFYNEFIHLPYITLSSDLLLLEEPSSFIFALQDNAILPVDMHARNFPMEDYKGNVGTPTNDGAADQRVKGDLGEDLLGS